MNMWYSAYPATRDFQGPGSHPVFPSRSPAQPFFSLEVRWEERQDGHPTHCISGQLGTALVTPVGNAEIPDTSLHAKRGQNINIFQFCLKKKKQQKKQFTFSNETKVLIQIQDILIHTKIFVSD